MPDAEEHLRYVAAWLKDAEAHMETARFAMERMVAAAEVTDEMVIEVQRHQRKAQDALYAINQRLRPFAFALPSKGATAL
jgi:hypothetical protein